MARMTDEIRELIDAHLREAKESRSRGMAGRSVST